jgi:molybdenum cofactor guanylyltransferase
VNVLGENCVAAVLIGGASRRMGVDKATLDIGGVALGRVVAEALGVNDGRTVIACGGTAETADVLGLAHLADDRPGEGPLVATASVLRAFAGRDVIIAACDLGGLDRSTVNRFEQPSLLGDHDVAVAVVGKRQPSLMRWASSALPLVDEIIEGGVRSLHGALDHLRVVDVEVEPSVLVNLNTPADLEVWRGL